jgi:hypothetical protein
VEGSLSLEVIILMRVLHGRPYLDSRGDEEVEGILSSGVMVLMREVCGKASRL